MPRTKRGLKPPPSLPRAPTEIVIQFNATPERRRALKDALAAAVANESEPWQIRVSSTLVYARPDLGVWWLKVSLSSSHGKKLTVLIPDRQTPALITQAVAGAVRGQVFTVACSSCGRIRLDGSWQQRKDLKVHARLTHGVCLECREKVYPDQHQSPPKKTG